MLAYIVIMASPFLNLQLFTQMQLSIPNVQRICQELPPIGSVGGVMGFALGSLLVVIVCEFIAVPIGILAAIYSPNTARRAE